MDLYQAAHEYNARFQGFNLETGAPAPQASEQAMGALVQLAAQSDLPADGKLRHLDLLVAAIAEKAPRSASVFNQLIVDNPSQKAFAKTLEITLAVLAERSPETWQHVQQHTALTMMYYERQTGLNNPQTKVNVEELLTLLVGALGHDLGKVAIDPQLLHKSTRVEPGRFNAALQNYRELVPDYPEKLHDTMFLEEANNGKIVFATSSDPRQTHALIVDIGKDLRRSEECWLNETERQRHNAIWERINTYAKANILRVKPEGWLAPAEQQALTMAQRGTVTPDEMKVIESHDAMSEAFMKQAPLPDAAKGAVDIVSMDRFRHPEASQSNAPLLADVIHTTDVFEALTADRSYRKGYAPEEAMKVMDGMAREGKVNGAILKSMGDNGTITAYASQSHLQSSAELIPASPAPEKTWVQKVMGFAPKMELPVWTHSIDTSRRSDGSVGIR